MKNRVEMIKNYFIPSDANDHRPHFLRKKTLFAVAFFALFIELAFFSPISFFAFRTNFLASVLPGVLVAQTNENRTEDNLSTLTTNPVLQAAAQLKANDMATKGYFSHTTPDGHEPWYWLSLAGYSYAYAGENLAVNFVDSSDVTNAWMKSPEHRKNILNQHYTEIGIASALGTYKGKSTIFVVEFFGSPTTEQASRNVLTQATVKQTNIAGTTQTQVQTQNKTVTPTQIKTPSTQQTQQKVLGSATEVSANKFISSIRKMLTEPKLVADYFFGAIILLVLCGLALAIFIKIRIQHPPMIVRAVAIILLVAGLMYFNTSLFSNRVEIPRNSASVINAF